MGVNQVMTTNWHDFMTSQQAQTNSQHITVFPTTGNIQDPLLLMDLSHLGLLQASGEEVMDFLQGQLSNDIQQVHTTQAQLSSYCSPKGRVLSLLQIIPYQEQLLLQLPLSLLQTIHKRLNIFILRAKVTLTDMSDQLVRIGIAGEKAIAILESLALPVPATPQAVSYTSDITILRTGVESSIPQFQLFANAHIMQTLWTKIAPQATIANGDVWQHLNILAGIPTIYPVTSEAFVPQMINLQALHVVNFQKGCYPGQEVVARMKYLGKIKRRMYLAQVATDTAPQIGDNLYAQENTSGQGTGKIVDVHYNQSNKQYDMLCVLDIKTAENHNIYLNNATESTLQLKALPYLLE